MGEMREQTLRGGSAKKMTAALVLVVVLVVGAGGGVEAGGLSAAQCKVERRQMVNACNPLLYGKPPSSSCCWRIRVTHIQCICSVITPKLAAIIDVKRAIRFVEGCGRRVPRHFKCGSITTP